MAPDPSAETPRTALLDLLLEVTLLLGADMAADLARNGLTPARAHLLWVLAELGPSMQQTLAGRLEVTPRNVTGLVDGLLETGLVTRERHPTDRRAFLVTLTGRGRDLVAKQAEGRDELAAALFPARSEPERAVLLAELTGLRDRLMELVGAAGQD